MEERERRRERVAARPARFLPAFRSLTIVEIADVMLSAASFSSASTIGHIGGAVSRAIYVYTYIYSIYGTCVWEGERVIRYGELKEA